MEKKYLEIAKQQIEFAFDTIRSTVNCDEKSNSYKKLIAFNNRINQLKDRIFWFITSDDLGVECIFGNDTDTTTPATPNKTEIEYSFLTNKFYKRTAAPATPKPSIFEQCLNGARKNTTDDVIDDVKRFRRLFSNPEMQKKYEKTTLDNWKERLRAGEQCLNERGIILF